MKLHWGTGIVIAFIGFIAFIMYFVVNMSMNKQYDHDLVTEDYYKQELEFQNTIDKEKNAKKLTQNLSWEKTEEGIVIHFPVTLKAEHISGKVFLYRPSNKQFDLEIPISLSQNNLLIPGNRLLDGRWNITVDWQYQDTSYIYKKEIIY